ncbi:peptidoglycan-binding domain-containing protein [Flavilitoribacter nigricans]|uniref:Peptidoglycan binding-like domain-containing protein n=1 Tax=Flavilitoribacter nigricans (strain ATCC 23147 / DSM 23189 / NBRC 102662 / NCIMB 1420 / SS-2) TaxID=1122177 RepID=A0A2D0N4S2_FLAN2|nr:peptidoglycan-binding domain-containing protein [Flavilitoribacter nigricans]PHN03495.1 hypothetical protein CRP01_26195 [Flavilitoribacter nigricans DSM 23189 = NBRC 102662]
MTPILQLKQVLHLGLIDEQNAAAFEAQREDYFKRYHERFWGLVGSSTRKKFRGEGSDEWVSPRSIPGDDVKNLQTFLKKRGFMPGARVDGVYGYWTLASVRLFQEYVRTVEGLAEIGIPDGRVGSGTHRHMMRWEEQDLYCKWGPDQREDDNGHFAWTQTSPEYDLWMEVLPKIRDQYLEALSGLSGPAEELSLLQLQELNDFDKPSDSRKVADWSFDPKDIHLIGLRCNHEVGLSNRGNDDLFILLMNGMVFKFWGSTDPKPASSKANEPYLVEGQHKYRLSWHKVTAANKVYKALVPYQHGVLVFRDWNGDDALSEDDIRKGLKFNPTGIAELSNPNSTINIHWTSDGRSNWSAGCQVISGRSYVNQDGKLIDCSKFSAGSYSQLSNVSTPGVSHNRGAYTFISDFVFAYAPPGIDYVVYTLGRDEHLEKLADPNLLSTLANQNVLEHLIAENETGQDWVKNLLSIMKDPGNAVV